jgi:hypothetical protein
MVTIINEFNSKRFIFNSGEIAKKTDAIRVDKISINFPSGDDTEDSSISINLGTEETLNFTFTLYKEETERSDGSHSSVVTFQQIIPYLKRVMFKKEIGEVLYRIQMVTKFETIDAYYELVDFSLDTDNDIYPKGSLNFKFRKYA